MNFFELIISEKTNDDTDLYLMVEDQNINENIFSNFKHISLSSPIKLVATNLVYPFREIDYASSGAPEIVSGDFKKLVEDLGSTGIEFIPAEVVNVKVKKDFYVMNFTKKIKCIDYSRSKFFDMSYGRSYTVPMIDKNRKIDLHIFKAEECPEFIFVSEKLKKEFKKRNMFGCDFYLRS